MATTSLAPLALLICYVSAQVSTLCRPNERLLPCGGCQKTCDDPAPDCVGVCRIGCYCNEGEVRNSTGHCIALADCPPNTAIAYKQDTTEPRAPDVECPPLMEYRFCEPCNRTCENPNPKCPAQCARGCFCKGDLVLDKDGRCVTIDLCPYVKKEDPQTPLFKCGPHQVAKKCETCEKTCSNPHPNCPTPCQHGCFCEEGMFKSPSGECVKWEDCPRGSNKKKYWYMLYNYNRYQG